MALSLWPCSNHYLQQIVSKEMAHGLPQLRHPHHVCSSCAKGKQHRASFPEEATYRATRILELVHADLAGPLEVDSLGGSKYFMLLVDDFSRKTWVCFLSRKSDALSNFQVWLAQVENQSRAKVSFLRTDNGREFLPFDDFLASKGIQRQTTIPYTPSQNGVVERKNHTVKEMARSLLQHSKLPPAFCGEAIATSIYILNRS